MTNKAFKNETLKQNYEDEWYPSIYNYQIINFEP